MDEITLQLLLEAGCHFGHKAERWHPKASQFIFTEKDGIHIVDLAKTKAGLEAAAAFIKDTVAKGGEVLFVATKRQARGVVKQEVEAVGAPYFVERWIGGFLTNWEQVKKNIDKIIRLDEEQQNGTWKKFPKHEQVKLGRYLKRLKIYYGGVLTLKNVPQALFVVDVKKEDASVREGRISGAAIVAIVDTNADPAGIDYVIPANDDAVGSIQFIAHVVATAYREGKELRQKEIEKTNKASEVAKTEAPKEATIEEKPREAGSGSARKPDSAKATTDGRGKPKKTA
ncbi:30S ribosomal protein S2 [Candidatus Gottesmanbacteria bacterium RIFCSPLOWO2_01_FULL_48_11]|nr:MAG: 30S ribosomal protein S2 [Candidatus Gottesmanbacteria bacterium RIFCSPLOWO2_01_FULL_48_11]